MRRPPTGPPRLPTVLRGLAAAFLPASRGPPPALRPSRRPPCASVGAVGLSGLWSALLASAVAPSPSALHVREARGISSLARNGADRDDAAVRTSLHSTPRPCRAGRTPRPPQAAAGRGRCRSGAPPTYTRTTSRPPPRLDPRPVPRRSHRRPPRQSCSPPPASSGATWRRWRRCRRRAAAGPRDSAAVAVAARTAPAPTITARK